MVVYRWCEEREVRPDMRCAIAVAVVSWSGIAKERQAELSASVSILRHAEGGAQLPRDANKEREAFVKRILTAECGGDGCEGQLPY